MAIVDVNPADNAEAPKTQDVLSLRERAVIQRAMTFLIVLESNAYAKDESVLAHYVRKTIEGLAKMVNPETEDSR